MRGQMLVTVVGNIVDDPELRFTPTSRAVCKFRVVTNPRYQDGTGHWKDGESSFVSVIAWGTLAENIAGSLKKGDRVMTYGVFGQRQYEVEGQKRSTWEMTAEAVGPDLLWASAKVSKMQRASQGAAPAGGSSEDLWATAGPGN